MKKSYISPLAMEVSIEAGTILVASLGLNGDKEIDTSAEGGQLAGGRRGEWGNLWN